MLKKCGKCKEVKPLSEFHKDSHRKDKLRYCCKTCVRNHYDIHKDDYFLLCELHLTIKNQL